MTSVLQNLPADALDRMAHTSVLVVGDLMLDHYVYGQVSRLAPEAPVPVLAATQESFLLGGAGGVVANLGGLGARTYVLGAVANDPAGEKMRALLDACGGNISGLTIVSDRPSTVKMRFMAGDHPLLRTDYEKASPLSAEGEAHLIAQIETAGASCGAVIVSDYGKGVVTPAVLKAVMATAGKKGIPVLVDPKGKDFTIYKGADAITPNAKELAEATNMPTGSDDEVIVAARALIRETGIATIIAKRSEKGMSIVTDKAVRHYPATAAKVAGVAGAGDTVIATLAAALAAGIQMDDAAAIANQAAGVIVAKPGTTPIMRSELQAVLAGDENALRDTTREAFIYHDWDAARQIVDAWKAQGLNVGFTNGCFDIVHYGHVNYLNRARERCDRLIIGLNSDSSITRLKGPGRPVHEELSRASVMAALGAVDMVAIFGDDQADDDKPIRVIDALRPDICFKGGDYKVEDLPEAKVILAYGGKVEIMPLYEGHSTTSAIQKMKKTG